MLTKVNNRIGKGKLLGEFIQESGEVGVKLLDTGEYETFTFVEKTLWGEVGEVFLFEAFLFHVVFHLCLQNLMKNQ